MEQTQIISELNCHNKKHCQNFCFNGVNIIDENRSANKMMLEFLCTDQEFPKYAKVLKFGPCTQESQDISHEGKLICSCINKQWQCQKSH